MNVAVNDGFLQIFNVEHGACALYTGPLVGGGFGRIMVDCGHNVTSNWYPGNHLGNLGVSTLEKLVITNYDEDHVSGYPNILSRRIHIAWMTRNLSVTPETLSHLKSESGMGAGITALKKSLSNFGPPPRGEAPPQFAGLTMETFCNSYPTFDDENNLSLVLHLNIRGQSFLFPGDLETAGWEELLNSNERFQQVMGSVTVLVAAHHGREDGICTDVFDVWGCKPQVVVISDDYKQYDTQNTTAYYATKCHGIAQFRGSSDVRKVLTTRKYGELSFSFTGGRCLVS